MRMHIMSVYTSHAFRRAEKSRIERLFGAAKFTRAWKRINGNGSTQLHASDFSARRNAHMESGPKYCNLLKAAVPAFHLTVSVTLAVWCRPFRSLQLYFERARSVPSRKYSDFLWNYTCYRGSAPDFIWPANKPSVRDHREPLSYSLYTCTCCFDGQSLLLSWTISRGCTASIQCIHVKYAICNWISPSVNLYIVNLPISP